MKKILAVLSVLLVSTMAFAQVIKIPESKYDETLRGLRGGLPQYEKYELCDALEDPHHSISYCILYNEDRDVYWVFENHMCFTYAPAGTSEKFTKISENVFCIS